jgi:hypothetical protein
MKNHVDTEEKKVAKKKQQLMNVFWMVVIV